MTSAQLQGSENDLYEQIAQYLALAHPSVLAHWDLGGVYTASHKARNLYGRLNRDSRGFPDLVIYEPAYRPGSDTLYAGLAIELKVEGTRLRKRDGSWASPHIAEQAALLERLKQNGYVAVFARGFDEAVDCIASYMDGRARLVQTSLSAAAHVAGGEVF